MPTPFQGKAGEQHLPVEAYGLRPGSPGDPIRGGRELGCVGQTFEAAQREVTFVAFETAHLGGKAPTVSGKGSSERPCVRRWVRRFPSHGGPRADNCGDILEPSPQTLWREYALVLAS